MSDPQNPERSSEPLLARLTHWWQHMKLVGRVIWVVGGALVGIAVFLATVAFPIFPELPAKMHDLIVPPTSEVNEGAAQASTGEPTVSAAVTSEPTLAATVEATEAPAEPTEPPASTPTPTVSPATTITLQACEGSSPRLPCTVTARVNEDLCTLAENYYGQYIQGGMEYLYCFWICEANEDYLQDKFSHLSDQERATLFQNDHCKYVEPGFELIIPPLPSQ